MPKGRHSTFIITLTPEEQHQLTTWQRSTTVRSGLARRARILLLMAEGATVTHAAALTGTSRRHCYKWIQRWQAQGIEGLHNHNERGRKTSEYRIADVGLAERREG